MTAFARTLALLALVACAVTAAALAPSVLDDESVGVVALLVGTPVVLTAAAVASFASDGTGAVVLGWAFTTALLAFILVFGLGVGFLFAPAAILLLLAQSLRRGRRARVA